MFISYQFYNISLGYPSFATGISSNGEVVAYDEGGRSFTFKGGNFTTFIVDNIPWPTLGINNAETIGVSFPRTDHGRGLYSHGVITDFTNPASFDPETGFQFGSIPFGINYIVDDVSHGFLATTLTPPAPSFSAESASITVFANFTSTGPTTLANLVPFTVDHVNFGKQVGVLDTTIYAYESLGAALSDGGFFQENWGPTAFASNSAGDVQFVFAAYEDVFGHEATQAQSLHFIQQLNSFESIYAASGAFGDNDNIHLVARGAVYGQMLGFQSEAPLVGIPAEVV